MSSLLTLGGDIELNPGPNQQLKIALFNARSLVNKSAYLEADVYSRNFDIIAVTETHLDDTVNSSELFPQHYRVFRHDRNRRGGGVLVAVDDNIICNQRDLLDGVNAELLMLDIHYSKNKSFVFGIFYRPPSGDSECLEILQRNLECLPDQANIILVGDFNLGDIDWSNNVFLNNSSNYEVFADILSDNFLTQMVLQPTRKANILDLVLTNNIDMVLDVEVGEPISDHNIITFSANVNPYRKQSSKKKFYNFDKADWPALNDLFKNIPWDCAFVSNDINDVWNSWIDLFNIAVDQCIPKKNKRKNRRAPWISEVIVKLARKKKCLYKKAKSKDNAQLWSKYKDINNLLKKKCNKARWDYLKELANNLQDKKEHKLFWNYVNSKRGGSNDLTVIKLGDGNTLTDESDISECMNDFFTSIFTRENLEMFPTFPQVVTDVGLSSVQCSRDEVAKLLQDLNPRKSPGADGIHPLILKNCATTLAPSLCMIFNLSFSSGKIPDCWKQADIIPIHKKGAKNKCDNYRPVSLTSIPCKVCEKIVRQHLVKFWINRDIFTPDQFGFMKGKSCLSQLLSVFHDWSSNRNSGLSTDVVFLDFSKAFDSVPHERLLLKLHSYGIRDSLLSWVRSFLTNRHQRVVVRGNYSSWGTVTSGVPQGTVLGPVLFLIYINDITRNLTSECKLFADDLKVYKVLRNTDEDTHVLQSDLHSLERWSIDWQLKFNTKKCEVMRISKKNDKSNPEYKLYGSTLKTVSEVKDLGIYITSNLSWSLQATKCANKANRVLGFIKRTVGPKSPDLFSKLYKSLVRPILEYCSPVWSPHLRKDIDILEKVQRRASRFALGVDARDTSMPYDERLDRLKWPTLEKRRIYSSLTECYKTINELNGLKPQDFFIFADKFRPLRSNHRFKLKTRTAKLNSYKYSFFIRIIEQWNNLSSYIAEAENLITFKKRLRTHMRGFI